MQFEYDPVQLIEEIKKRPGLWNFHIKEHKSKLARERLWRAVIKALNPATEGLSPSDLHDLEIQLQKRWKSMRDAYTKQINYPHKYQRHRPYVYMEELKFLSGQMSHTRKRPYYEDEANDVQDTSINKKPWNKMAVAKINESEDTYEDITFLADDDDDELQDETSKAKSPNVQNFAFADVESSPPHDSSLMENDPDRMFLLSLLPDLRSVPEHLKLSVKMNMMQILQNASGSTIQKF